MPQCIKDKTKSYKGTEPSPKGLGYCAHSEDVGTIKKGNDGNKWIIANVKNIKRWIRYNKKDSKNNKKEIKKDDKINSVNIDCSKFAIYEKKYESGFLIKTIKYDRIIGLEDKKGYIRKFISYNNFEKEYTKIPDGYKKNLKKQNINQYCSPIIKLTQNNEIYKEIKKIYSGYKTYFIHFNGGRPYLIYIKNNDVIIYGVDENKIDISLYEDDENKNKWMYINLVGKYKAKEIFIGKSPLIPMTNFSGGYGKYFDGNTILLLLNNNNYLYISNIIEEFSINDKIEQYYSFVGNNDVPYPIAISKKNIYFFRYPTGYLSIDEFPKFKSDKDLQKILDKGLELDPFLIEFCSEKKDKPKISLEEFKKIKNKSLDDISLQEMKDLAVMFHVTTSGTKKELAIRIEQLRGVIVYKK